MRGTRPPESFAFGPLIIRPDYHFKRSLSQVRRVKQRSGLRWGSRKAIMALSQVRNLYVSVFPAVPVRRRRPLLRSEAVQCKPVFAGRFATAELGRSGEQSAINNGVSQNRFHVGARI